MLHPDHSARTTLAELDAALAAVARDRPGGAEGQGEGEGERGAEAGAPPPPQGAGAGAGATSSAARHLAELGAMHLDHQTTGSMPEAELTYAPDEYRLN
jgi:hypothetical protein